MSSIPDDPQFAELMRIGNDPRIRECLVHVGDVAGYELPLDVRSIFLKFHRFVTTPQPAYITEWRLNPKTDRWYHDHVNGVLGDVQNTTGCVHYHAQQIQRIHVAVEAIVRDSGVSTILGRTSVAGGNTLRWDFEYQAFVFAARRLLDYLTRSMAAFFRQDFHSFSSFGKSLRGKKPEAVADALMRVHGRHRGKLEYLISEGGKRSVRDRISHYNAVGVGCLNISARGLIVGGGGEDLRWGGPTVGEAIERRVLDLVDYVREILGEFENAARLQEANAPKVG